MEKKKNLQKKKIVFKRTKTSKESLNEVFEAEKGLKFAETD